MSSSYSPSSAVSSSADSFRSSIKVRHLVRCAIGGSMLATALACAPAQMPGVNQPEQAVAQPSLIVKRDIDLVRLQGVLASAEEVEVVAQQAAAVFGAEMIINDLKVDQHMAKAGWLHTVMDTAGQMQEVPGFSLTVGNGQLTVGGSVDSKLAADEIADMASGMAGMQLAVSSSLVYPIEAHTGTMAAAELIEVAQAQEVQGSQAAEVIPVNPLEQPAVAIQQPDFQVIPAVAIAQDAGLEIEPRRMVTKSIDVDADGVPDNLDECHSRSGYPVDERGCQLLNGYLESVRFYGTTSKLTEVAKDSLDGIAGVMQEHPVSKFAVISYSKDVDTGVESRVQARKRAFSVVDYLVTQGVEKNRLSVFALGSRQGVRDQIMIKEVD